MRVLLQQKTTALYFKDGSVWTPDPAQATDFLSSTKAIDFCASHKISGVQLVLKFDKEHYEIVLPMMGESRHGNGRYVRAV